MEGSKESRRRTSPLRRASFVASFAAALTQVLIERRALKYRVISGGKILDLTPKELPDTNLYAEKHKAIQKKVNELTCGGKKQNILSAPTSLMGSLRGARTMGGLKLTISDILEGVPSFKPLYSRPEIDDNPILESTYDSSIIEVASLPFIKVSLRRTSNILLYEQNSKTVLMDSDEAVEVEYDNTVYDYLTNGDGSFRLRHDAEVQTKRVLTFNRNVGMQRIICEDASNTYSQNVEMRALNIINRHEVPKPKDTNPNSFMENESFQLAAMRVERILANNYYVRAQMRYRNLTKKGEVEINSGTENSNSYNVNELFRFAQPEFLAFGKQVNIRKAVSDVSFCCGNPDLIAVGYGIYSYAAQGQTKSGNVCVWSIKNPQNPERTYSYKSPVTAVEFSPFSHSLLAVGTSKGWVEVLDIATEKHTPLAMLNRAVTDSSEPIVAIKFYFASQSVYAHYNQFLTFSLSSIVQKFRFLIGPYLFCVQLTSLDRVMGKIEGLPIIADLPSKKYMVRRRPIGLNLFLDMVNHDTFYLLTDQGCIHHASMRHMNTYETTFRTHRGAVNCMEFSPWSPKIYLTCGNDWYIRIWMIGIMEPLCELTYNMAPINHAAWSPTHSSIILSLNRDTLDIWDLRCSVFKPKRSISFEKGFNTLFQFSRSGTTLVVGKENGDAIVCALDDMPPEPHYQYDNLEKVLYDAIENDSVRQQYKESEFFGYPKKKSRREFPKIFARI